MKNLIISLVFILGMGLILSTASCSKQATWEELPQLSIDIYKNQGAAHISVDFVSRYDEEHEINSAVKSLNLIKGEVKSLTITALEENTVIRINGQIIYLDKGDQYIYYSGN